MRRRIAPKAIERFKERIRELTWRTRGISIEQMIGELRRYMIGWRGYFGFCETPSILRDLDRLDPKTSALLPVEAVETRKGTFQRTEERGIGKDLAAKTAGSAHGPWRLSNSKALAIALPNAFFDSLGLPSLAT